MKRPGLTTIVCSKTWNKSQKGAQSNKVYPFSENQLIKWGTMIILTPNHWCLKVFTRVASSTSSPISSTNAFPFYPRWIKHEKRKAWEMLDSPNKWFTWHSWKIQVCTMPELWNHHIHLFNPTWDMEPNKLVSFLGLPFWISAVRADNI